MDRVKTHIDGFDELVDGGFPRGSNILITGPAGTGKTIFSLEFLYRGAVENNEKGIYFTFEEKKQSLIEQAKQFGWDLEKEEKKGRIKIVSMGVENIGKNTVKDIMEIISGTKANRVIIDSISTLSYLSAKNIGFDSSFDSSFVKKFLYSFISNFKALDNLTCLFISHKSVDSTNSVAEYICDGIVSIEYETIGGEYSRNLLISKMRKTKNDFDLHPIKISSSGIEVFNL